MAPISNPQTRLAIITRDFVFMIPPSFLVTSWFFPNGRHSSDLVVTEGENAVTVGTYQETHRGEMQSIAPTNRQLRLPVVHFDRVVDL
jgi:predicted ester cyclase